MGTDIASLSGITLGQYQLKALIGKGRTGAVYHAAHSMLQREVAIKVWSTAQVDPGFSERFSREMHVIAQLEHPGIVPIFDFGIQNELVYLVMRLLTSGSLEDRLRAPRGEQVAMTASESARLVRQIASALDYLHSRGLIAEHLTPGNILFDAEGNAALTDVGIQRLLQPSGGALTAAGAVTGNPAYDAPEQIRGEMLVPQSDQYQLGEIAFLLNTGHLPFRGDSATELAIKKVTQAPDLSQARLPAALKPVLQRALAITPGERYPTATDFAVAFEKALREGAYPMQDSDREQAATRAAPPPPAPVAAPPADYYPQPAAPRSGGGLLGRVVGMVGGVVGDIADGIANVLKSKQPSEPPREEGYLAEMGGPPPAKDKEPMQPPPPPASAPRPAAPAPVNREAAPSDKRSTGFGYQPAPPAPQPAPTQPGPVPASVTRGVAKAEPKPALPPQPEASIEETLELSLDADEPATGGAPAPAEESLKQALEPAKPAAPPAPAASSVPDWLMDPGESAEVPAEATRMEVPDWLRAMAPDTATATPAAEIPDWLRPTGAPEQLPPLPASPTTEPPSPVPPPAAPPAPAPAPAPRMSAPEKPAPSIAPATGGSADFRDLKPHVTDKAKEKRFSADRDEPASGESSAAAAAKPDIPLEDVRFTAFHPKEASVETWYTLLVYAHIEAAGATVQTDAEKFRAEMGNIPKQAPSAAPARLARGTEISIVPDCEGVTFNPERISLRWAEDMHRAWFRFRAGKDLAGTAGNLRVTVYVGPLIVAMIKSGMLFNEAAAVTAPPEKPDNAAAATAHMYRRDQIFISYSHQDTPVVLACKNAYQALGFGVLIDIETLRSGQDWNRELRNMIDQADIFQLFWSERSASSMYCKEEWDYALAKQRASIKPPDFIRPVFWEKPMPRPPETLGHLHFDFIPLPKMQGDVEQKG
jgi:serine/threonine-protein kinase